MKFIYLADTHIGGRDDEGYRKQPRYLGRFQEILDCLKRFIAESGDIDFVLHGGDMVEETTEKNILAAVEYFNGLPCPTYLTPGNHDLTRHDSIELWLKKAPEFFPGKNVDFRLSQDGVQIDAVMSNWGDVPAYWNPEEPQIPWLSNECIEQVSQISETCLARIIVTHAPVYGLPPEQHGGEGQLHPPLGDFTEKIGKAAKQAPLILGAHNHMNMAFKIHNRYYVTTAALSEMPFEFKVIEANSRSLSMQTVSLNSMVSFRGEYDFNSTCVQGRKCDRQFDMLLDTKI